MRSRDIIGKRVVHVTQWRKTTNYGRPVYHISSITFEDGTTLMLDVHETGDGDAGYIVGGTILKLKAPNG